jgi:hypothetical protein
MNPTAKSIVDCWVSPPGTFLAAIVYCRGAGQGYRASVLEYSKKIDVLNAPSLQEMKQLLASKYPPFAGAQMYS